MRRGIVPIFALGLGLSVLGGACDLPFVAKTEHERTVLVDYHYDQFNAVFAAYLPRVITLRVGDALAFKTAWTGEPHTITLGTLVDKPFREVGWSFLKNGPPFSQPPTTPEFQAAQQELNQFEPQTGSISDIPRMRHSRATSTGAYLPRTWRKPAPNAPSRPSMAAARSTPVASSGFRTPPTGCRSQPMRPRGSTTSLVSTTVP